MKDKKRDIHLTIRSDGLMLGINMIGLSENTRKRKPQCTQASWNYQKKLINSSIKSKTLVALILQNQRS